ncbi:HNH endonuclease, partial [Pseudomonas aeruginosa]
EKFVVLRQKDSSPVEIISNQDEALYQEGEQSYASHLIAERSQAAVSAAKNLDTWICEICGLDFNQKYGVRYIEAHHKIPISTYATNHTIKSKDLALLCPNCHKAVH